VEKRRVAEAKAAIRGSTAQVGTRLVVAVVNTADE